MLNKFTIITLYCSSFFLSIACYALSVGTANAPYIYVLGIAQDAGLPQAACYKAHCLAAWEGEREKQEATSLAIIDPQERSTTLIEATPNLPQQLYNLHQEAPSELYKLNGVFLTHAHIGHYSGLMYFGHEVMGAKNVSVFAMPRMAAFLRENGPWSQLVSLGNIKINDLTAGRATTVGRIRYTPLVVPHRDEFSETVGYLIEGPNKRALFVPDINKWALWKTSIVELVKTVDFALLDATFYTHGELPGRDMSKIPHPLVTDTMALFENQPAKEKGKIWFIHMNHTNPLLDNNSKEKQRVLDAGYHVASKGLRLTL